MVRETSYQKPPGGGPVALEIIRFFTGMAM